MPVISEFTVISEGRRKAQIVYKADGKSITRHAKRADGGYVWEAWKDVVDENNKPIKELVTQEIFKKE